MYRKYRIVECIASSVSQYKSYRNQVTKVTDMGAKIFSHTHRLTMCGLKKLASGVFPESWMKSVGRTAVAVETDQKQEVPRLPRVI